MTKKIWLLAVVLLISFNVVINRKPSNLARQTSLNNQPAVNATIVIGYSNWAGWWPWAIAESEGLQ